MRSSSGEPRGLVDASQAFLLACVAVFGLALWSSFALVEPSAYLLPRVVAVAGLALAVVVLAVDRSKPREPRADASPGRGLPVPATIGFTAVYFSLVPLLGFPLATALAIAAFGHVTGFPRRKLVVALAVVVPLVLHLTFAGLLKAPLPAGVLGGLVF